MTQGDLEKLPGGVGRLMKDLENRIMEDIVRRIRQNCFSTATADWQITRLAQLGESEQYIQEYVMQALQATEKELDEIFSDETYREYMGASRGYKVFGQEQIPFAENRKLQSLISSVKTQTKDELENITRTMGFVKKGFNNRMTVQSLSNFYRSTMDNAVMDIASGAFSYNEVLKRTINQMTQSGIRTIDYSSGTHNRIDVAARRAVLTGFRQVQGKINEQVANDLGTDSYEVTVHIGARPTHQVWEGKVYTYQQLVDICGLGSVTGLKGANCYHDYNAFIPGVSVRTYTDEQLDQIHEEENKKRLYNGKEYTTYEALQRQRELERHARKYREDVHLLELGGGSEDDINASKGHYRRILAEYGDFSKKMKLPLQKDRIYHDGLKVDMETPKEKTASEKILKTSSDSGKLKELLEQEGLFPDIPELYLHHYEDYETIELDENEKAILTELYTLSENDMFEYGCAIINGEPTEPFTSKLYGKVGIPDEYLSSGNVKFYHAHTNCTIFSAGDLRLLTYENVDEVAVITRSKDVYRVTIGDGYRPDKDEFDEEVNGIRSLADELIKEYPEYYSWTPDQRIYMAIREQAFLICRRFGWRLEGGFYGTV